MFDFSNPINQLILCLRPNKEKSIARWSEGDFCSSLVKNLPMIRRQSTHRQLISRRPEHFNSQLNFSRRSGDVWANSLIRQRPEEDTCRPPLSDLWATVQKFAEKKCRRPNGDQPFSVQLPAGLPRMIAQRSEGVHKRKVAGRRLADLPQITRRSPLDLRAVSHGWSTGDLPITPRDTLQQYKSRTLVEELTSQADLKVDTTFAF